MEVMYPRGCRLDVHKSCITAGVRFAQSGKPRKHIRRFACTTRELRELVVWWQELAVEHVAMESRGVYGKPVWNILEGHFPILLANAQHIKAVPGARRTPRTVRGSRNFCSTDSCGTASFPRC